LIEIVRTDKDRKPMLDSSFQTGPSGMGTIGVLPPITVGRQKVETEIKTAAAGKLGEFGIELMDVRLKRVDYNPDVLDRIYQRMISERQQIAQRFRSEGEGEAAKIAGKKERDMNEIQSGAYLKVQTIRGEADAGRGVLRLHEKHGNLSQDLREGLHARALHRQRSVRSAQAWRGESEKSSPTG